MMAKKVELVSEGMGWRLLARLLQMEMNGDNRTRLLPPPDPSAAQWSDGLLQQPDWAPRPPRGTELSSDPTA